MITLNKKVQIQRLIHDDCTDEECEVAVNRAEWYAEYNRTHPGFFDAVIVTGKQSRTVARQFELNQQLLTHIMISLLHLDDINEGYENLRNLVLTYLGLNQDQIKESTRPKTSDEIRKLEETFSKELDLPRSGNLYELKIKE